MDGGEVFKFAVKKVPQSILQTLEAAKLTTEDIDWYLFHRQNARNYGNHCKTSESAE